MGNINGMVLHLYKHLDGSMFDTSVLSKKQKDKERTLTAFGNFDRLCFSPVEKFVNYLSESSSAYRWIGGRKDIMLYPLEADVTQRHFVFGEKEDNYVQPRLFIEQSGEKCQRKFLLVSMLYVSGRAKASVKPYNVFLECCKNAILKIVEEANAALKQCGREPVICEIFGTFNSSELAILWGADQFTDVQYIVDQLRYMYFEFDASGKQEPIFISSYTIVALTGADFDSQDIFGGAMIQLAASTMRGVDEVKEYNAPLTYLLDLCKSIGDEKAKVDFCAGEYDYIIESLPPQLELLTKQNDKGVGGSLHIENSEFKKFFSHSTTRLFYREEDIDEKLKAVDWKKLCCVNVYGAADHSNSLQKNWENIREIAGIQEDEINILYNEFRSNVLQKIQSTSSLCCNLDLLFSDYVQCMNITPDRQWAKDLKVQFFAALNVLNNYLQSGLAVEDNEKSFIDWIIEVVSVLQEQINHVSDAGKLFFEEPCSHSESTSQYDLLFHMYYGAIKQILSSAYECRKGKNFSRQSRLIPLIRFKPVPSIESNLYMDMAELDERLVDISLPYDAWCEPGHYIPLLIHELYHYIAPVDRHERNETFAKVLLSELNTSALQALMISMREYAVHNDTDPISKIEEVEYNSAVARIIQKIRRLCAAFVKKHSITELIGSTADDQWRAFQNNLFSWCEGDDENYVDEASQYGEFLTQLCNYICASLKRDIGSAELNPHDKTVIKELIVILSNKSTADFDEPILVDHIKAVREEQLPNLAKQLREILPDLGMTSLSAIDATEYMLIFATFQDKMQKIPSELHQNDIELSLRIGLVVDKLLKPAGKTVRDKLEAFDNLKDDFCNKYEAYVNCCSWSECKAEEGVKRAGKWFAFFKIKYEEYLGNYGVYGEWLQNLVDNQFMPVCGAQRIDIAESAKTYFTTLSSTKESSELFKSNISIVHRFQVQPFLEEIDVMAEDYCAHGGVNPYSLPRQSKRVSVGSQDDLCISTVYQLNAPILRATKLLTDTHKAVFGTADTNCRFWYRGTQNANFDILPSVMVHFLDEKQMSKHAHKGENAVGTLWEYQRSILERFKYQADGAPEFINSASYTTSDYVALMQHYGQHTLYLDWSEDAYSSLYFALENEILQDPQYPPKYGGEDAALYILDPMLYNRARKMLVDRVWSQNPEQFCPDDSWFHQQGRCIQEMPDGYIPNLSIGYNKNRYGVFSLDVPETADVNSARKTKYIEVKGAAKKATLAQLEFEMWNLPLAVYTSRLNPRIRSQSGQFIAYSPFSIPVYSKDNPKEPSANHFSYLSLLKVQKYFQDCFCEEQPFMYEVKISAFAKEELAEYLRNVGINRYRIYPELGNIKL